MRDNFFLWTTLSKQMRSSAGQSLVCVDVCMLAMILLRLMRWHSCMSRRSGHEREAPRRAPDHPTPVSAAIKAAARQQAAAELGA